MTGTTGTDTFSPLRWDGVVLSLLDQRRLPTEELWVTCETAEDVFRAIRGMLVRGAPAIGCAAAYGIAIAARRRVARAADKDALARELEPIFARLAESRPTAVNLFWALDRMRDALRSAPGTPAEVAAALERQARAIHADDIARCRRIGAHGESLVPDGATVLTHCNAGALATGGYGTALGVIRAAHEAGKRLHVIADETRPYLQGARLTAWELVREGLDVTVIPDGAAAALMRRGEITCCVVGADRIAANGDVANKIGTYGAALAARAHDVPFYVAAPTSTLDLATATGDDIPIEERDGGELLRLGDMRLAPSGVSGRYPAFDITPAALIAAIITDRGVARAPYEPSLRALMSAPDGAGA